MPNKDWNWPSGSGEEDILKFCPCIFTILLSSPLRKGQGLPFTQTWIRITQKCFVSSLVEIGPVVLDDKVLKFCQQILYYLLNIIFHWKRVGAFVWTNFNPLYPGMLCAICFVEIGSKVLVKKIFKYCQCIFAILLLSTLDKEDFSLNKVESPSFTQGCFVPIKFGWNWLKGSSKENF